LFFGLIGCRHQKNDKDAHMLGATANRLIFALTSAFAWAGFYLLRFCERLFPTRVLSFLLWPLAAVWSLAEPRHGKLVTAWRRFPAAWRPAAARFFLWQSLVPYHARLVYTWPDRLRNPRWLSRCHLEGDLTALRNQDRGIILASLHFGPFETLPYWLRAHGIPATALLGQPARRKNLMSHLYGLSPPADVPVFLSVTDFIPLPRFTHVRQFLGPGRRLVAMVDVDRGIQFQIPFENRSFRMATGAIRLAAMADAELVPCLITETAPWKFAIHFGAPVPRLYLGNSPDMQTAGAHLLREFMKVISRRPAQCCPRLLSCISPPAGNGVSDRSAVAHASESH
jgi:lauroyl/myristoyl acyltransferase